MSAGKSSLKSNRVLVFVADTTRLYYPAAAFENTGITGDPAKIAEERIKIRG